MKKSLAILLIFSLLLNVTGCYSFRRIYYDEQTDFSEIENNDVRVRLTDGKIIRSDAYHHALIFPGSEFIVGEVNKYLHGYNYGEPFGGRIMKSDVDSSYLDTQTGNYTVWLKSNKTITFPKGYYLVATKETEPGFWYWNKDAIQKVNFNDISSIEVDKINVIATSLLVGGGIIAVIFVIFLATFDMNLSLGGGNGSW